MADQSERIILEVDDRQALAAEKRTARGMEQVESSAKRATAGIANATEQAGQRIVRTTQASQTSINRLVAQAERKAAFAGKTGIDRLNAERDLLLKRVGGDEQAIRRINAAYADMGRNVGRADTSLVGLVKNMGLAYLGFRAITGIIKTAVVDTALYAARTEQLGVALGAVAKANGIAITTTKTLEGQLKSIGITTQEARMSLSRLIAGGIGIEKATELARAAQDVGRVAGIPSSDALERLVHAIITLQPELFRYLGLNISLEQAYKRQAKELGKTVDSLTEYEKRQIATNEALRVAGSYAGVYAASFETAGGQILSMDRYVKEFKNSIGNELQAELYNIVKALSWMAKSGEEAGESIVRLGRFINPFAAQAREFSRLPETIRQSLQSLSMEGVEDLSKFVIGDQLSASTKKFLDDVVRQSQETLTLVERERGKAETARIAAEKHVAGVLRQAQLAELSGVARIVEQRRQLLEMYGLSAKAIQDINAATRIQAELELRKMNQSHRRTQVGLADVPGARTSPEQFREAQVYEQRTLEMRLATLDDEALAEADAVKRIGQLRLQQLEATYGRTVQGQIAVANERLRIESDTINREAIIHVEAINRRMQREVEYLHTLAQLRPEMAKQIEQRVNAVILESSRQATDIDKNRVFELERLKQETSLNTTRIIQDYNQQIWDQAKSSADSLFDALITGSRSAGDAIKRMLLGSVLAPIKDIFSTAMASILAPLSGGRAPAGAMGGFGGLLGGLGGFGFPGAPGGTPGFAGPVGGLGGIASGGGLLGMLGGLFGGGGGAGIASLPLGLGQTAATTAAMGLPAGALGAGGGAGAGIAGGLMGALAAVPIWGWLAIGGAIGGGFLLKHLFGGAEKKLKEKIRASYGVDVKDKKILSTLMQIVKEGYGGNIDLGIRSPQVRDMVQLYAMQTGQSFGGIGSNPPSMSLYQSGGSLFQNPSYSGAPALNMGGMSSSGQAVTIRHVTLQVNGQSAADVLEGRIAPAISRNSRAVSDAVATSQGRNYDRRQGLARQLQPGLVTG